MTLKFKGSLSEPCVSVLTTTLHFEGAATRRGPGDGVPRLTNPDRLTGECYPRAFA